LSDEAFSNFISASAFYATYKLANYSAFYGLPPQTALDQTNNPQTGAVENNIILLMINGTANNSLSPQLVYSEEEKNSYTINGWKNQTAKATELLGFKASFSEPYAIQVKQIDPWMVQVSLKLDVNISDPFGNFKQNKTFVVNTNFSIQGFPDPFITRNDIATRGVTFESAAWKQIFRNENYKNASSVKPILLREGNRGAGWFYGPITADPDLDLELRPNYILVTNYFDGLFEIADTFGAVIVTNLPFHKIETVQEGGCNYIKDEEYNCINCLRKYTPISSPSNPSSCSYKQELFNKISKPFMLVDGNSWINNIPKINNTAYVLINNEKNNIEGDILGNYKHHLVDMTRIRDMAICGFYLESSDAPSFFQRMVNSNNLKSPFGIESFVIGTWAGGNNSKSLDERSRLDWKFYSSVLGKKIKGMMGCKNKQMCSSNLPIDYSVGFFRLGDDDIIRYGLENVSCGNLLMSGCR